MLDFKSAKIPEIESREDLKVRIKKAGFKNRGEFADFIGAGISTAAAWGVNVPVPLYVSRVLWLCSLLNESALKDELKASRKIAQIKKILESD